MDRLDHSKPFMPVRIAIDDKPSRQLIAGLSTHVSIDTSR